MCTKAVVGLLSQMSCSFVEYQFILVACADISHSSSARSIDLVVLMFVGTARTASEPVLSKDDQGSI